MFIADMFNATARSLPRAPLFRRKLLLRLSTRQRIFSRRWLFKRNVSYRSHNVVMNSNKAISFPDEYIKSSPKSKLGWKHFIILVMG